MQGCIQQALSRLLRADTAVTGAGRTDTGVNARMMIAHFDGPDTLPADLAYRLNGMLGRDIAIYDIWPVAPDAHARFDATERTYRYFVATKPSPFLHPYAWLAPPALDFEAMNEAARYLIGRRDFTSFSKLHTQTKTNICDLRHALWSPAEGADDLWHFEITADRFLRNMVRAVVGTLVDVGRGKMAPESIVGVIDSLDRCAAGISMPPHPLFLWDIKYGSC